MTAPQYPEAAPPSDQDLAATVTMDYDNEIVQQFIADHVDDAMSKREKAIALFNAVRDEIRYTPYRVTLAKEGLAASHTIEVGEAYCIPKALLYAATLRAVGIPARLGLADVINHLSSEKLDRMLQTDEFVGHGYTALWLDDRWIRATPTFNRELCEKVGVKLLEFDGENDALFHPYDESGNRHMQYLRYHGEFSEFDAAFIVKLWEKAYPHWFEGDLDFFADNKIESDEVFG
jgi:transglutaminase-like putative cysteine protease